MSGAPSGRFFDCVLDKGTDKERTERFFVQPNVLSDNTIAKLKAVLIKRRREHRQALIQDFSSYGKDLPKSAQEAFAKELIADAKSDVDIEANKVLNLLTSVDSEALATLLMCTVPEIKTFEKATEVMNSFGNLEELFEIVMDVANEEQDKVKNSDRQPETA